MISLTRLSALGVAFTKPSDFEQISDDKIDVHYSGDFVLKTVKWYSGSEWVQKPISVYIE